MMIAKFEMLLGGGSKGEKTQTQFFVGSSNFSASRYPRTPPKLQKSIIWVFCNIPPKFKTKYWQENFIL